jgi:hypothetical protein
LNKKENKNKEVIKSGYLSFKKRLIKNNFMSNSQNLPQNITYETKNLFPSSYFDGKSPQTKTKLNVKFLCLLNASR